MFCRSTYFWLALFLVMSILADVRVKAGSGSATTYSQATRYSTASFIAPASPAPSPTVSRISTSKSFYLQVASRQSGFSFATAAKRKGAGGGGASASGATTKNKVQVKLLKYVAGIGQKGDIIRVSPAVFNNVLRPSQAAELITEEQLLKEQKEAALLAEETKRKASALKNEIESLTLTFLRKAGPDGKLFGGIGPKGIIEGLKDKLGTSGDFLENKGVKIVAVFDGEGSKVQGDIKHTGAFTVTISLTNEVSTTLKILVQPEI